jgi:hypothetical protein
MHRLSRAGYVVELELEGLGPPRSAQARFDLGMSAQDREDVRWYLEDFLQYPVEPAPRTVVRVESRLAALGKEMFTAVFEIRPDCMRLREAAARALVDTRLEVVADAEGTAASRGNCCATRQLTACWRCRTQASSNAP